MGRAGGRWWQSPFALQIPTTAPSGNTAPAAPKSKNDHPGANLRHKSLSGLIFFTLPPLPPLPPVKKTLDREYERISGAAKGAKTAPFKQAPPFKVLPRQNRARVIRAPMTR